MKQTITHTPDRRVGREGAPWREGGGQPVPRAKETPRAPRSRRLLDDGFSPAFLVGGGISLPMPRAGEAKRNFGVGWGCVPRRSRANDLPAVQLYVDVTRVFFERSHRRVRRGCGRHDAGLFFLAGREVRCAAVMYRTARVGVKGVERWVLDWVEGRCGVDGSHRAACAAHNGQEQHPDAGLLRGG